MDPILLGSLAAMAGGAGGELGKQSWNALVALVRRPFQRAGRSSGETELAALEADPQNPELAVRLERVLDNRAAADPEFEVALEEWHGQAQAAVAGTTINNNSNTISGNARLGNVIQAGTIYDGNHIHYHGSAQPPSA
ncbi:hypothetical protein OU787_03420 [Kitasatospora sp. YST-16]|uniref:hypothetical protein n=1 Tax=Kitasatospora sp. YST-16 TaxID=2998080 RepID=UPI002284275D|nr:hypothetical protein [Kitasatospora sp. YST-16]WAL70627.1 hypothetical protein OU787_03420 [Kitasatospora sp. YST-16]WNW36668.1 hypothetical protein RKE32_03410 [Streptomyces sp. Li-HN-5-13]